MTYAIKLTKYSEGKTEKVIIVEVDTLKDAQDVVTECYQKDLMRHPHAKVCRNKFSEGMTVYFPEMDDSTEWVYSIEEAQ